MSVLVDVAETLVELILRDGLRAIGWVTLKVVTFGIYKSSYAESDIPEGAVGLLVIAAALWLGFSLSR